MAKNDFDELLSFGVDIGKDIFHLVGFDKNGQLVLRKKIKRMALVATFEELPRCIVGMEACMSAHFVSRTLRKMGFESRIIPAIYVQPFSKGQKNDYNDAESIAEAALRPNLKTVSEKTREYLIDTDHGVIVDVEATRSIRQAEVGSTRTMLDLVKARFVLHPERLIADTAYGTGPMLGWLVERKIAPHIPVFDKSGRTDGT
jgi:transposase